MLRLAASAVALITLLAVSATGCSTTKPWQREYLAAPVMSPETTDPLDRLHDHLLGVREGAVGGMGGGGGGCGCN
jgi:hypothetical protein